MEKAKKNPALDWGAGQLRREAFAVATNGERKKEVTAIDMGTTASGNPRFPSRADGAEAGIVRNGIQTKRI